MYEHVSVWRLNAINPSRVIFLKIQTKRAKIVIDFHSIRLGSKLITKPLDLTGHGNIVQNNVISHRNSVNGRRWKRFKKKVCCARGFHRTYFSAHSIRTWKRTQHALNHMRNEFVWFDARRTSYHRWNVRDRPPSSSKGTRRISAALTLFVPKKKNREINGEKRLLTTNWNVVRYTCHRFSRTVNSNWYESIESRTVGLRV